MAAAMTVTHQNVWRIGADPAVLDRAAASWRGYTTGARDAADRIDGSVRALSGGAWAGPSATEFDTHRRELTRDVRLTADLARRQADELERAARVLRRGQQVLDTALAELAGRVSAQVSTDGATVTFDPRGEQQTRLVVDGVANAGELRRQIDVELRACETELLALRREWDAIAANWVRIASGWRNPYTLPPEATATSVLVDGDHAVINTGYGDDRVRISADPATGEQVVEVNGVTHRFPSTAQLTVRTGEGNDEITVAPGTSVRLTLLGSAGDDVIRGGAGDETILGHTGDDRIYAGAGNDRVSGGAHNDYIDGGRGDDILSGGEGYDVVYGLSGDDHISGGAGRDYLEGGTGRDTVDGGVGDDVISGGRDDDTLRGGGGDDVIYAGHGTDTVDGGTGTDTLFAQQGDRHSGVERVFTIELRDLGRYIRIDGSDEFVERVQADLDMLRASPHGQEMLAALDRVHGSGARGIHETLSIREAAELTNIRPTVLPDGRVMVTLNYPPHDRENPGDGDAPPITGLYHEFAHIVVAGEGTSAPGTYQGPDNPGVPNDERQAVGLTVDVDEDGVPDGLHPGLPRHLTENALRREMGWPERQSY
jgi:Ca2+-binding RTX toxin-like protein